MVASDDKAIVLPLLESFAVFNFCLSNKQTQFAKHLNEILSSAHHD